MAPADVRVGGGLVAGARAQTSEAVRDALSLKRWVVVLHATSARPAVELSVHASSAPAALLVAMAQWREGPADGEGRWPLERVEVLGADRRESSQ